MSALWTAIADVLWYAVSFNNFEIPKDVIHVIVSGSAG